MAELTAGPTPHTRCRVVLDNDWSGDPDGVLALAHHLLSPANRVVAITTSLISDAFEAHPPTVAEGVALVRELLAVLGLEIPVAAGVEKPTGAAGPGPSPAGAAIVAEALRDDPLPLYVVCGGPLTNVAAAVAQDQSIIDRFTLVWIGGSADPDRYEYNRDTDALAAELVLGLPGLRMHQFPVEAYRQCAYSLAELRELLSESGELGAWLWGCFATPPDWVEVGEIWPLGDSPPVLVTALTTESCRTEQARLAGGGTATVYTQVDTRLLFGDMRAKFTARHT